MTVLLIGVAALGLVIGSFLNVVAYRLPLGQSLMRPGSHCPRCDDPIRPWHNVPVVGWIVLRGRCRACAAPISVRYPLVELGTAAMFVAVALRLRHSVLMMPAYLYLAAIAVALALIDVAVHRLPDAIVLPSYVVAVLLLLPTMAIRDDWAAGLRALLGMAALLLFYFALAFAHPGGMGLGDVKLAGVLGIYLGFLGWGPLLAGTFLAFLFGGVVGAALLVVRRAGRKSELAFGPYMLLGAFVAIFVGNQVTSWYSTLITPG